MLEIDFPCDRNISPTSCDAALALMTMALSPRPEQLTLGSYADGRVESLADAGGFLHTRAAAQRSDIQFVHRWLNV